MKLPLEIQKRPLPERRPINPYIVLLLAIVLPGVGHVAAGMPSRGLVFVFFMLLFGWITFHLTTPDHSVVGRIAGGLFIYALSITDAYKWARFRWAQYEAAAPARDTVKIAR
ncbi:hypothetical protein AUC68_02400 [Methyloceanibacter methanicus]|uniref:Uncharacterized protein n=1 Tax=Methyloceanibacter methanicus TaxID=1774968 RepID=A0A1E3W2D9_9HYPH|nr:hypothetical protein [Methyloceanibacter methanicus]ODR99977.1 hypothetical protein AUC68_02400 [Methyloceanibacter methanicus]